MFSKSLFQKSESYFSLLIGMPKLSVFIVALNESDKGKDVLLFALVLL